VTPAPTTGEVAESLKLLQGLGLLARQPDGAYTQGDAFINASGSPHRKPAITRFQQSTLSLAQEAWDRFGENEISMRTATLALSEATATAVKAELKSCVERILALAQTDEQPADKVFHIKLNFFPMTKNLGGLRS
jgi:uncharacterized protein (TIGR02147 family)